MSGPVSTDGSLSTNGAHGGPEATGDVITGEAPPPAGFEVPLQPAPRGGFWRKRSVLIIGAIAVFVAASVVSDLPTHNSRGSQITAAKAALTEINTDMAPCALAVSETFTILKGLDAGTLTTAQLHETPSLLRDDMNACSYTNSSLVDLGSIQLPNTTPGRHLNQAAIRSLAWAFPDARLAIGDVNTLVAGGSHPKTRTDLAKRERQMAVDRAAAEAAVRQAGSSLDTTLPQVKLTVAP